jgi:hypothetical protein
MHSAAWVATSNLVEVDDSVVDLDEVEVTDDLADLDWFDTDVVDLVQSKLEGSATRFVFNGSRDTVMENVAAEQVRFARYASATACAFCRLQAIRGAVYLSKQSAGERDGGFHDSDRCMIVPVRDDEDWEPPDYVAQWEAEYAEAARHARGAKNILRVMRSNRGVSGVAAR